MVGPRILRVVVASPGDVAAERKRLDAVVAEVNEGVAAATGFRLELIKWEEAAFPGFHPEGPQGVIDPILRIEDCDFFVGIFWKRFFVTARTVEGHLTNVFRKLRVSSRDELPAALAGAPVPA